MKTVSAALEAHLQGDELTLAKCCRVELTNGTVLGFTEHDADIAYGGLTYVAASGYSASTIQTSAALSVDNLELQGILYAPSITEEDLRAGLWDYAEIRVFMVNWADLTMGELKLRRGWLGEVTVQYGRFVAEVMGMAQPLQQTILRLYSKTCDADLGDARCQVNLATYTVTGNVTTATSRRAFTDTSRPEANGHFNFGKLTWTSGLNDGLSMEVGDFTADEFTLKEAMPYDVAVGDTYSVYPGCAKRLTEDCKTTFNNVINFQGAPHTPGMDDLLKSGAQQ